MKFSYEWLQSFFNKKLPAAAELARLILKHGFEVEGLEKKKNDWVIDVNILSNRPDCRSHIGLAREIGAILGYKPNFYKIKPVASKKLVAAKSMVAVEVKNPEICPRYTAMVMVGIKVAKSPDWLARRLEACGLRSINNVVDATNYVMLETGQPLHAFDWDKLQNAASKTKVKKIIVRLAKKGEKLESLDGKIYNLTPEILLIADETGPLAVAGIKGGKRAEIDSQTAAIVLESANFNPKSVRRAGRALGLATDASTRFEHNLDPSQTLEVCRRVCQIVEKVAGGQILAGAADKSGNLPKSKKIILNLEKAEKILGRPIQSAQVKKHLEALGLAARKVGAVNIEVLIPARRSDINFAEDLVEEIGRIAGYDLVAPQIPCGPITPPQKNYFWQWKNKIKDAMICAGYSETRNYSFISDNDCQNFAIDGKMLLEVANPVNADLRFLRPTLLVNLLKNICKNHDHRQLNQFEIGRAFAQNKRDEPVMLAGFSKAGDFWQVKGALEFVFQKLGIAKVEFLPLAEPRDYFDGKQSAKIVAGKKEIGAVGMVSPAIAKNLVIEPLMVFELSVDAMAELASEKIEYQPLSFHPEAGRDISVDMPVETLAADVAGAIKSADDLKLIENFEIPDAPYVYPDKKIKNILFRFHLRAKNKTLDAKEIAAWQEKSIAAIEKNPDWRVKK